MGDFKRRLLQQEQSLKNAISKQTRDLSRNIKQQEKSLKKISYIKQTISKEGRIRILAKRKHEVMEKYNNQCADCKKSRRRKTRGVTLQIHHRDGNNRNNKISNLILLCPNHHYSKHSKGSKLNKMIRKRIKLKKNNSVFSFNHFSLTAVP